MWHTGIPATSKSSYHQHVARVSVAAAGLISAIGCYPPNMPDAAGFRATCSEGVENAAATNQSMRDIRDKALELDGQAVRVRGGLGYRLVRDGLRFVPDFSHAYFSDGAIESDHDINVRLDPSLDRDRVEECAGDAVLLEGTIRWNRTGVDLLVTRIESVWWEEPTVRAKARVSLPATTATDMSRIRSKEGHVFDIDRLEVTTEEYGACVRSGGCEPLHASERIVHNGTDTRFVVTDMSRCNTFISGHEKHPMNCVTWSDAARYCHWAHKRLPTEDEWYATWKEPRSTEVGAWRWEDTVIYKDPPANTHAVGTDPVDKTPLDVFDMDGNVEEWTATPTCYWEKDCSTFDRVIVGGRGTGTPLRRLGWFGGAMFAEEGPGPTRDPRIGFRCAR